METVSQLIDAVAQDMYAQSESEALEGGIWSSFKVEVKSYKFFLDEAKEFVMRCRNAVED